MHPISDTWLLIEITLSTHVMPCVTGGLQVFTGAKPLIGHRQSIGVLLLKFIIFKRFEANVLSCHLKDELSIKILKDSQCHAS